ncbi:hypothetical protein CSA17_03810 [bacterium DOLJORAL78_65_58]|nr:MAG: hypothetical protein CSB20_06530 [bacterium DOLZORAL124_64_63]PIE76137.1 MAG: hypothetical protein CSA17_03810 [bacterium DOLJORAL78_65_58]
MLIAIDIDGTLLNTEFDDVLPQREIRAMEAARLAGHTVVLCTGRNKRSAEGLLELSGWFPADLPLVLLNGATVWGGRPRRQLANHLLEPEDITALVALFRRFGVAPMIYGADSDGGILHHEPGPKNSILTIYLDKRGHTVGAIVEVADLLAAAPRRALEVGSIDEKERVLALSAAVGEELGERVKVVNTRSLMGGNKYYWAEVFSAGCGKAEGLRTLREHHPEVEGPLVAIGDNYNDLDMFAVADFRVVMANAPDDVREAADLVTLPVQQNGAALVLEQLAAGVYPPRIEV